MIPETILYTLVKFLIPIKKFRSHLQDDFKFSGAICENKQEVLFNCPVFKYFCYLHHPTTTLFNEDFKAHAARSVLGIDAS